MSDNPVAAIAASLERGEREPAGKMIDAALRAHHGSGRSRLLCDLHQLAAEYWIADDDQAAFHRTHAYVYALEGGFEPEAQALHAALRADNRI